MKLARSLSLTLGLLAPWCAQATQLIDQSTINCSESLTLQTLESLTAQCTGNMSIVGGTWTSDTLISLIASGDLFLDGVTMLAPNITIVGQQVTVGGSFNATSGHIDIHTSAPEADGSVKLTQEVHLQAGHVVLWSGTGPVGADVRLVSLWGDRDGLSDGTGLSDPDSTLPVPEPSAAALALIGLATLAWAGRRKA